MSFSNSLLLRRFEDLVLPVDQPTGKVPYTRGCIVLAESDPSELEHIASILENLDFNVLTAGDGETALRLVREQQPLLVLSSLDLPVVDGYKLCQTLRDRKETEAIPFMFIVERGEFPDHLIGHESHAHDYIQKPISVPEFKNRIQSLLNLVSHPDPVSGLDSELEGRWQADLPENTGDRGKQAQRQELCEHLRKLLNEAALCLEELERLVIPERERERSERVDDDNGGYGTVFQPVENASGTSDEPPPLGEEEERKELSRYLAECRERERSGGSLGLADGVSEGVEDIFAEFFEMESFTRKAAEKPFAVDRDIDSQESSSTSALETEAASEVDPVCDESERKFPNKGYGAGFDLYQNAASYVLGSLQGVVNGEAPDIYHAADLAELIVDSVADGSSLIFNATDRDQIYAVSRHSVNVAIFATRIAQTLGKDQQCRREVCLAALLHELGVGKLPSGLIHREGPIDSEELRIIRQRPAHSSEIIGKLGREYHWLARIAGQVTERENGSGSPMGLIGEEIDDRARIIGIADVFDACIHRRP
ncbi:MAG: HD domain-containing phosphohydrolase, partial [bacterium]